MLLTSPLDRCVASFYCRSFTKGDLRIERVLSAVETVVGWRLNHYFQSMSGPKKIPGDRTAFVSQWLPGLQEKFGSQLLCPKTTDAPLLLVNLDNILSLPELVGARAEVFGGAVHITYSPSAPFAANVVARFAELVAATECFHACVKSPPLDHQSFFTRQRLAARLEEIEKLRWRSAMIADADRQFLLSQADQYVYDLDETPLTGVTPAGKTYALRLHWINYWDEATARRLGGFPDDTLDRPLEGLYERLPGGWLLKLTPDPTDLDKPEDQKRVQWAYERFAVSAD